MTAGAAQAPNEFRGGAIGALVASVVAMAFGPTGLVVTTFSLFIEPMSRDLGWSRADAALPVTLMALAIAISSPFKGWAVDRWGPRALVLPLTVLLGLSIGALAIVPSHGWLVYLIFTAIGLTAPGNVPFGRVVAGWFDRRLGLAYGLLGFGFTLTMPIALQLGRWLVDGFGWRTGYAVYGAGQFAALLLLALLFHLPDRGAGQIETPSATPLEATGLSPAEALCSSTYWLLLVNLVAAVVVISAIATHGVPMLAERGLNRALASWALSAFFIGTTLSQPLLGLLLDRYSSPRVTLPFGIAALVGFGMLLVSSTPTSLFVALALIGLGCGGESGTTQFFVTRYFGLRRFSTIYGSIQPFTMIGGALLGASGMGYLFDRSGSYGFAVSGLTFALVMGTSVILLLPKYRFR